MHTHLASQHTQQAHARTHAVHYAHTRGVVHRDLKPANIMIDDHGEPQVMDFGLAKIKSGSQLSKSGMLIGTLQYMAPEQVKGKSSNVDSVTDVYALGAILYELITTRPVFTSNEPMNLMYQITTKKPVRPSQVRVQVPADLERICLKTLEKNKKKLF